MTDIVDLEEAFTKSGAELFKELYRVYPVADAEDYFKNGQWKNEVMKADLVLIESHRRESGAPDVADLEDIKVPNLPTQTPSMVAAGYGPASFAGMLKPAGFPTPVPLLAGAAVGTSTPVVEIRLIALFVAKWKLDPATAKTSLAKLTPVHRRYVIQNFKTTVTGVEATKELDTYIAACEEDKSWDTAVANGTPVTVSPGIAAAKAGIAPKPVTPGALVGAAGATVVAPNPALSGLKRPLTPAAVNPLAWQQNKRPTLASGMAVTPGVVRPPGGPAMVRPPVRPGKGSW